MSLLWGCVPFLIGLVTFDVTNMKSVVQAVFSEDMSYYHTDLSVGISFEDFSCTKQEGNAGKKHKTFVS